MNQWMGLASAASCRHRPNLVEFRNPHYSTSCQQLPKIALFDCIRVNCQPLQPDSADLHETPENIGFYRICRLLRCLKSRLAVLSVRHNRHTT